MQVGGVILVFETIRDLLAEQLGCDEERISPSTVILEDLEAEPEDLAELMLSLEQEFGVEWTEEDLNRLETVADLTAFVEEQI